MFSNQVDHSDSISDANYIQTGSVDVGKQQIIEPMEVECHQPYAP